MFFLGVEKTIWYIVINGLVYITEFYELNTFNLWKYAKNKDKANFLFGINYWSIHKNSVFMWKFLFMYKLKSEVILVIKSMGYVLFEALIDV